MVQARSRRAGAESSAAPARQESALGSAGRAGTARSPKGEQTRRAILRAAIERFGRDGFRATSVADIARDAGVSGTLAYAYFANKEDLFLAAVDEDAASVIRQGLLETIVDPSVEDWAQTLVWSVVAELDGHPLARRLLAGLEPDVTARVLEIPALAEVRKAAVERLRDEQLRGRVRADLDPELVGNGIVTVMLSLLMSVVQLGVDAVERYGAEVAAVFHAALEPVAGGAPIEAP